MKWSKQQKKHYLLYFHSVFTLGMGRADMYISCVLRTSLEKAYVGFLWVFCGYAPGVGCYLSQESVITRTRVNHLRYTLKSQNLQDEHEGLSSA